MADKASTLAAYDAWLAEVQAIGTSPPPPVGVRIRVTALCKVRKTPDQNAVLAPGSPEDVGKLGTIKPGVAQQNGYTFIDFDDGVAGWAWPSNFVIL